MTKILYIPSGEYIKFISEKDAGGLTVIYENSVYYNTGIEHEKIERIFEECYNNRFCLWITAEGDRQENNQVIYDKNCFEIIYD